MVEGSPFNSETNKARQKESIYRKLYSNLLQQNRSVFQEISNDSTNDGNDAFADEKGQLAKIFNTEIANLAVGIGVTFTAFAALRFGSRFVLNQFGGQRAQALKEADVEAKKRGTERTQNIIGTFVEGWFSLWLGYRGYDYASHQSKGSYETIAEIPLCKHRSRMSEALCPGWIDVTENQIPKIFWRIYENGELRDERTWTAIRQFSINCEKRHAFEDRIRKKLELSNEVPISLPHRVPSDIFTKRS